MDFVFICFFVEGESVNVADYFVRVVFFEFDPDLFFVFYCSFVEGLMFDVVVDYEFDAFVEVVFVGEFLFYD